MRIGVIHHSLNVAGGGERLCLKTIEALKEAGHEVVLATVEPTNWKRVERILGKVVKPDKETSLLPFKLELFGIYMRLLTSFSALKLRKKCDLLINTHGDALPVKADIIYMHYPMFALLKDNPVSTKYSESIFWRAYFAPYEMIQGIIAQKFLEGLILTNSNFSRKAIKKYTGKDSVVVYPPVDIKTFAIATKSEKRENLIVSCGRYSAEKNYEFVLKVAEKLREKAKFIIIGSVSGRVSRDYYEKLSQIKRKKKLDNVELLRNVSFGDLLRIYGKAKIYLHAMKYEHFGISVVEAMAAGMVPVVHRSGGSWEDILEAKQGVHGFSYTTLDEAVGIIKKIISDVDLSKEITSRNTEYIYKFSSEAYKRRFLRSIKSLR